jgi:hypothetical protein
MMFEMNKDTWQRFIASPNVLFVTVDNSAAHVKWILIGLCKMVAITPPEDISVMLLAGRI